MASVRVRAARAVILIYGAARQIDTNYCFPRARRAGQSVLPWPLPRALRFAAMSMDRETAPPPPLPPGVLGSPAGEPASSPGALFASETPMLADATIPSPPPGVRATAGARRRSPSRFVLLPFPCACLGPLAT